MNVIKTELPGVLLIEPRVHGDDRGFFLETYHRGRYAEAGIDAEFVQDNHSKSTQGVLRGLHLQLEHSQGKLIRVIQGEIFDVAVDVRVGSPTFGQAVSFVLTADSHRQLYVPPQFAHGFCVLSPTAEVEYKCTDIYHPQSEITVLWNDPDIGIAWPVDDPVVSEKDASGLRLEEARDRLPTYRE